jgi:hypothetical protein
MTKRDFRRQHVPAEAAPGYPTLDQYVRHARRLALGALVGVGVAASCTGGAAEYPELQVDGGVAVPGKDGGAQDGGVQDTDAGPHIIDGPGGAAPPPDGGDW